MVQIPTRTRTLSFSVREAGRQRPNVEEPDAKRARRHAPLALRSTPLAPKSVNLTVTAVPVPFPADADDEWGTDKLPMASCSSPTPRAKKLVAKTTIPKPSPPPPVDSPPEPVHRYWTRARTPSPLAPYWKANPLCTVSRQRKSRTPPEPLARKALKAHFAQTPHGAAVIKLGVRRAIAQAECVAAVERVRKLSGDKKRPTRLDVSPPTLLPPVLMDADIRFEDGVWERVVRSEQGQMRFPTAVEDDSSWVPLSVQSGGVPVQVEECDIVEMETEADWLRV